MSSFELLINDKSLPLTLEYRQYNSEQEDECGAISGAYIFRPKNNNINGSIPYSVNTNASVFQGQNLLQIRMGANYSMTNIRIYNTVALGIEIETFVDSIPYLPGDGHEVIMRLTTPVISNQTYYTDSMGMEMQQRIRNYRSNWPLQVLQPVAGNYYPVQSAIYLQDTTSPLKIGYFLFFLKT